MSETAQSGPAGLDLTIVGSSSSIPRPGRACSAYLVQSAQLSVVLDLGSGAFANLRRYVRAEDVHAVVISHMHPDHFLDLIPMRYALRYGPRTNSRKPIVFLPPGGEDLLHRMVAAFAGEAGDDFLDVYDLSTYDPKGGTGLGDISFRFAQTTHYIPAYAVRCSAGGTSVTYSADTAPDEGVAALARNTNAFLCEATLLPNEREPGCRGHLSAREAGEIAHAAAAQRLILTHYGAEHDADEMEREARIAYGGAVVVADDHNRFSLRSA